MDGDQSVGALALALEVRPVTTRSLFGLCKLGFKLGVVTARTALYEPAFFGLEPAFFGFAFSFGAGGGEPLYIADAATQEWSMMAHGTATLAEAMQATLALTPSSEGQKTAQREITTALEPHWTRVASASS